MSYTLNYVERGDKQQASDDVVKQHGVAVFIPPKALFHIIGTTMDFSDTKLASEFTFTNPNATALCGCGESFTVDEAGKS